jgi:TRAP-type mannitol/chloroaromatic compound transport system substrate-binding protein
MTPATCTDHNDGVGDTFYDCTALCNSSVTGGSGTNCSQQGAEDACTAYAVAHGGTCSIYTCGSGQTEEFIYLTNPGSLTSGLCSSWSYYGGAGHKYVGQVFQNTGLTCTYGCAAYNTEVGWQ